MDAGKKAMRNSNEIWVLEDKETVILSEREGEQKGKEQETITKTSLELQNSFMVK